MSVNRNIGLEQASDGHLVGRDPSELSLDELQQLGHQRRPPLSAIRAFCLQCVGADRNAKTEVKRCSAVTCPLWPFRMKVNPWRKPLTADQRAQRSLVMSRTMARRQDIEADPAGTDDDADEEEQDLDSEMIDSEPGSLGPEPVSEPMPAPEIQRPRTMARRRT